MHSWAHLLDKTSHFLQPVLILIVIGSWVFAMVGQISAFRSRRAGLSRPMSAKFVIGMLIFAGVIGSEFAIGGAIKSVAVEEIKSKLFRNIETVTVNGKTFYRMEALTKDLRAIHDTPGHHSHPTRRYQLVLKMSEGFLTFELCRDSENSHEYWVYYPEYHATASSEIGRVLTDSLDGI